MVCKCMTKLKIHIRIVVLKLGCVIRVITEAVSALLHWVPALWRSIAAINASIFWSFRPTRVFFGISLSPRILCHSSCRPSSPQVPGAVLMSSGLSLGTTLAMISRSACLISTRSSRIFPKELADRFNFLWRLCWCFLRWRVLARSSDRSPASVREGCSEEEDRERFSMEVWHVCSYVKGRLLPAAPRHGASGPLRCNTEYPVSRTRLWRNSILDNFLIWRTLGHFACLPLFRQ